MSLLKDLLKAIHGNALICLSAFLVPAIRNHICHWIMKHIKNPKRKKGNYLPLWHIDLETQNDQKETQDCL